MPGEVTVSIPARVSHVALVRAAASALAARLDFSFDRITDVQIAVDEVCSRLLAVTSSPTRIDVTFRPGGDRLVVRATADGERRTDRVLFTEWSRVILDAIADRVDARTDGVVTTFEVELSREPA